ncbi:Nuclear RNA export factor 1, partial [Anas platyrhynchos]
GRAPGRHPLPPRARALLPPGGAFLRGAGLFLGRFGPFCLHCAAARSCSRSRFCSRCR